jgi:hypothetical protein
MSLTRPAADGGGLNICKKRSINMGKLSDALVTGLFVGAVVYGVQTCFGETPEETAERRRKQDSAIRQMAHGDSAMFATTGFNIVARTGSGVCNANGGLKRTGYYGSNTDVTYLLGRPNQTGSYTACAVHSPNGTSIVGLSSIDKPGAR